MKKNYLLYLTNAHHEKSSYEVIGIFEDIDLLLYTIEHQYNLPKENYEQLKSLGQTQGLETNYLIETVEINVLKKKIKHKVWTDTIYS